MGIILCDYFSALFMHFGSTWCPLLSISQSLSIGIRIYWVRRLWVPNDNLFIVVNQIPWLIRTLEPFTFRIIYHQNYFYGFKQHWHCMENIQCHQQKILPINLVCGRSRWLITPWLKLNKCIIALIILWWFSVTKRKVVVTLNVNSSL